MTSAFIPKHSYNRDELLSCGHGKMFGPGNARLPIGQMLMVDRVVDISATGGSEGKGRALGCGEVKFTGEILPTNKKVVYELDIKRLIERKLVMGIADGTVSVDGKVIYTATGLRVGLFKPDESIA